MQAGVLRLGLSEGVRLVDGAKVIETSGKLVGIGCLVCSASTLGAKSSPIISALSDRCILRKVVEVTPTHHRAAR